MPIADEHIREDEGGDEQQPQDLPLGGVLHRMECTTANRFFRGCNRSGSAALDCLREIQWEEEGMDWSQ